MATAESVKTKIQGLIDVSNETTGREDTDLTSAVTALTEGYGSSKDSEVLRSILDRSITEFVDHEITEIGDYGFFNCSQLTMVDCPELVNAGIALFGDNKKLDNVNFPKLTNISASMFSNCNELKQYNLPNVVNIGGSAFAWTSITAFDFPLVERCDTNAFYHCRALLSVHAPKLTILNGQDNFNGCSSLISVDLPSLTNIPHNCFGSCGKITSMNIPAVKTISGNWSLASLRMTRLELPALEAISGYATFSDADLKILVLSNENAVCTIGSEIFIKTYFASGEGTIYVPDALVEDYKVATNWAEYADYIKPLSELPEEEEGTE